MLQCISVAEWKTHTTRTDYPNDVIVFDERVMNVNSFSFIQFTLFIQPNEHLVESMAFHCHKHQHLLVSVSIYLCVYVLMENCELELNIPRNNNKKTWLSKARGKMWTIFSCRLIFISVHIFRQINTCVQRLFHSNRHEFCTTTSQSEKANDAYI